MCGRTSLFLPQAVVESRFDAEAEEVLRPRYNIAPFETLPVITNTAPETIQEFEWGFLPPWADDPEDSYRPINARAETITEKRMFRDAAEKRRCLVIADGFYEWKERERGPSQPYRIEREDESPFAMAGLWSQWSADGSTTETVTIITTEPTGVIEPIHARMPVVLPESVEREWTSEAVDEPGDLLRPYPDDDLVAYPVSRAVNDPANDSAAVIERVEPEADSQAGLDDFA